MKILLTGASGFVGRSLCQAAVNQNINVRAFLRSPQSPIPSAVETVLLESINSPIPPTALTDIDTVIHLAARAHILDDQAADPAAEFFKINTQGTLNIAKAAIEAGIKHFIFISSIGAMTTTSTEILTEKSPCHPDTPYGQSKLAAEQQLIELCQSSAMAYTIIRPTLVYGPGNPGNMARLINLINKKLPIPLGSITNQRSFTYVGNLVDAILTCLTNPAAHNQTFLISDGQDLSTPELIRRLAQASGQTATLLPIPPALLTLLGQLTGQSSAIEKLLGSLAVDTTHIQTTLGWQAPYSIEEGIQATVCCSRSTL
jgi:nucleoside-diphosphate-sugar epimerase